LTVRAVVLALAAAAALAALPPGLARASPSEQEAVALTLELALELAEKTDPGLAAAAESALAASERARAAERYWLPSLTFDAVWARTDVPARVFSQKLNRGELRAGDLALGNLNAPDADSHLESTLGLRVSLDLSGTLRAGAARSRAEADAVAERARSARGDLRLAVASAFHAVAAAERELAAAESALGAARGLEEEARARHELGAALASDWLKARSRRRQREVERARAASEADFRRTRLRSLIGWDPDRPLRVEEPPLPPRAEQALEAWIRRGLSSSPEIAAAGAAARAAGEALRAERRAVLPSLEAAGGAQDDRAGFSGGARSASLLLQMRWSVFDPARRFRTAAAGADRASAQAARAAAEQAVRLAVEARWRDLRLAWLSADAAREDRTDGAEVFRVARERWLAGKGPLGDALDAEGELAAASAAEARAGAAVAEALAALERAAGAIP
jgi:outer membrane protein TolC